MNIEEKSKHQGFAKKEEIERKQLYFQGHVDGYAYLKKIKAVR